MKKILLLVACLSLWAKDILIMERKNITIPYTKDKTVTSKENKTTYYRYGIKNEKNRFITTGFIIVKTIDNIDSICKKHKLKLIKQIGKNIYYLKNLSTFDDVEVCAKLKNENIIYAKPAFKSKKSLK